MFAEQMLTKLKCGEIDVLTILMTDEAHFHLIGAVNKKNCRYYAPVGYNPHIIKETPLRPCHTAHGSAQLGSAEVLE